jgi:hypothetical protein
VELSPRAKEGAGDRKVHYVAKEKADSDKGGWFARWRERRKQSKLRKSERRHQAGGRTVPAERPSPGMGPNV